MPGQEVLVAGVDSSTQSCKVVVVEALTGRIVRSAQTPHPDGTEVDPQVWWEALEAAIGQVGGLDDVSALSVGGQQHGMVCLDAERQVIRPALLWNDTRSAEAATQLVDELGAETWAQATGSVPVASFTVTKLRWLADHEPEHASRIAAICLPHDWLTWKLAGASRLEELTTDRSDASGTGYFDSVTNEYRRDLLAHALRREIDSIVLPRVLAPSEAAGVMAGTNITLGPGCGDNAGAALGLGLGAGAVSVSLGTSGVVAAVTDTPTHDVSGTVAGFADATGRWLPLACTLNGSRVLDATAALLGVGHAEFSALALAAEPGSGGLIQVPFLEGERTPNLPHATGTLFGMTVANQTRPNMARAAVEGLLCLMANALGAIQEFGVEIAKVSLIGGAARSEAVQQLAPGILGLPVDVAPAAEYVALGAARQAAWVHSGDAAPPSWELEGSTTFTRDDQPDLLERWAQRLASTSYA